MINKEQENTIIDNEKIDASNEQENIVTDEKVNDGKHSDVELDWEKRDEESIITFGDFKVKEKTFKLTLAGTILATAMLISFITNSSFFIPAFSMSLDLSLIVILIGRRYIGLNYSALICLIFPWVSVGTVGGITGVLFIILQAECVLGLDYLFNKEKYTVFGALMVILLGTFISVIINLLIICPIYFFIIKETTASFGGLVSEDVFYKFELIYMVSGIIFNPLKLSAVYAISFAVWLALENSLNLEPNY